MATRALTRDLVQVIAEEMAHGVKNAVDCWMSEIDSALADTHLTTLGRLNAVREIVEHYKDLTGQAQLDCGASACRDLDGRALDGRPIDRQTLDRRTLDHRTLPALGTT
jgi:hypothetical protein